MQIFKDVSELVNGLLTSVMHDIDENAGSVAIGALIACKYIMVKVILQINNRTKNL